MRMRTKSLLFPIVAAIPLLWAIDGYFAQSPKKTEARENSMSQGQIHEPDKEIRIRNKLADLLASAGVRVGKTLPLSESQTCKEIRVRWQSSDVPQTSTATLQQRTGPGSMTLVASTKRGETLPRERSVELSTNQFLVIGVGENSEARWWRLLLDPRLVRSEAPGATGEIIGENYYLAKVDFMIAFPDDPGISELRFYHPVWTGKEFQLELISTLSVK
jgi:hypothetical protein